MNILNLAFDKAINHDCFTNLAKALQLLNYFKSDLDRAITGNELNTFQSVPPIYTTLMEASTTKNNSRIVIVIVIMTVTVTKHETATVAGTETEARVETQMRAGAVILPATHPVTITTTQNK